MAKITKATVKSFVNKNRDNLFISTRTKFNIMTDSVDMLEDRGFGKITTPSVEHPNNLNIQGVWITRDGNSFQAYDDGVFTGYSVWNCCGEFILAVKK